jgi:hypothetical protein
VLCDEVCDRDAVRGVWCCLQFLDQWDTKEKDGVVSFEEFCEYYNDVSARSVYVVIVMGPCVCGCCAADACDAPSCLPCAALTTTTTSS